jgi:hypothetical protein
MPRPVDIWSLARSDRDPFERSRPAGATLRVARRCAPCGTLLALALTVGAGSQPAAAQAPVVRDSAGVRIVENRAPAWGPGEAWRVETEPALSIGEDDGDDPYVLYAVRGGSVLSDGTVVVGISWWGQGSRIFQLRYFDAEGMHLASAGRYGQGPGEFERPYGFHRIAGDSLLVHDRSRLAVFGPRGELGRTGRFDPTPFYSDARLVSGSTVVSQHAAPTATEETPSGLLTFFRSVVLTDLETASVDSLGLMTVGLGHRQGLRVPFGPLEMGSNLLLKTAGGHGLAWIVDSQAAELRAYATDGTPEVIARNTVPPRPITPELVRRWREGPFDYWLRLQEDVGMDMRVPRSFPQERDVPSTAPAYSALTLDASGNVWVQVYPLSELDGTPAPDFWDVYDPTGIWMGTVEFPSEVTGCVVTWLEPLMQPCDSVLEIGDDYVLIRHLDELRTQRVRMHRLVKP